MSRHLPIEETEFFKKFEGICDEIWDVVEKWKPLAQDTVGKQLIRAADSVGANLVEGDGRFGDADSIRFFIIARASARETRYWIRRAIRRKLIPDTKGKYFVDTLIEATKALNTTINYRRNRNPDTVKEELAMYDATNEDPLAPPAQHPTPNTQHQSAKEELATYDPTNEDPLAPSGPTPNT